jgi:hypothetical protein
MNSALVDTAYAAVGGAILHTGLGLAVDQIRGARLKALTAKPETKVTVAANAAAELASGKPVTSAETLLSLDPNNVKAEVQVQNIADVVVEPGRVEPVDPAKPFGVGEIPQHYVADFKFDPNALPVKTPLLLNNPNAPEGYEVVSFNKKYFGDQPNVFAQPGAITPDDVGSFVSGHPNLGNLLNPKNQKSLIEVWQYLADLGLKHDDIDWTIPYYKKVGNRPKDKFGMPIRGVQFSGEAPIDLEIPGLTTVAVNEKLIDLPGGSKVRVQVGERIYDVKTLGTIKHIATEKNISVKEAMEFYKNLADNDRADATIRAEKTIEEVNEEVRNDIRRKFKEKNFEIADGLNNSGNYGARLPENFNNPLTGLILDTGGFQWAKPDQIKLLALQEIRAQNAAAVQAEREAQNLQKQIEDLLARRSAAPKDESTWWQPGDNAPIEVPAKDLVAQTGIRPEDANLDARMVAQDAEEIIAQFRAEMSETDLNVLKDFDRLAKEAEGAEVGFLQAANCVINNLL